MKNLSLSTTLLALFSVAFGALAADPQNLIIQTDLSTGIRRDIITTDNSGNSRALLPVAGAGAEFKLFGEGSGSDQQIYFLDQKLVGAYQPQAEVVLTSSDPYPVLRTRADHPFTYRIRVWGLSTDPSIQEAARKVNFCHLGQNYNPNTYSGAGQDVYDITSFDLINSDATQTSYSQLTGFANPTKKVGEERFVVASYPDTDVPSYSILANEKIQIWPVGSASFAGITDGHVIQAEVPTIVVNYKDSYPKSTTYVQVYSGSPVLGTNGTSVPGSVRIHDTTVPQNDTVTITQDKIEPLIGRDGTYTLEILTETPFNGGAPERLGFVSFNIQREVEIRGQVITSED